MKSIKIFYCVLLTIIMLVGCDRPNPPEVENSAQAQARVQIQNKDWQTSLFGPGPVNYGSIERQMKRPHDPGTESNVTGKSYRSLHSPRQTKEDDQEMIENRIFEIPGVTPDLVILEGGNAWVDVRFEAQIDKQTEEELLRDIEHELLEVNPRYQYHVFTNWFN